MSYALWMRTYVAFSLDEQVQHSSIFTIAYARPVGRRIIGVVLARTRHQFHAYRLQRSCGVVTVAFPVIRGGGFG
jgi:hypothetical protein